VSRISDPDAGSYVCEPCDFLVTPHSHCEQQKVREIHRRAHAIVSRRARPRLRHTGPK